MKPLALHLMRVKSEENSKINEFISPGFVTLDAKKPSPSRPSEPIAC